MSDSNKSDPESLNLKVERGHTVLRTVNHPSQDFIYKSVLKTKYHFWAMKGTSEFKMQSALSKDDRLYRSYLWENVRYILIV